MKHSKDGIEYKTSDIQALYGLSNKGLFYYEGKGLISPRRIEGSNYRIYTLQETARLHRCRLFRSYGFSVENSISLVTQCTAEELAIGFEARKQEIERDIIWHRMLNTQIDETLAAIRLIQKHTIPVTLETRPAMYRGALRNVTDRYSDTSQAAYLDWQAFLPIANASLCVSMDSLTEHREHADVNLGFIIEKQALELLNSPVPMQAMEIPELHCLRTIIGGSDDRLSTPERFSNAMHRIEANGLRLAGDVITRMIATFDAGDGMKRYDWAWFPVKNAPNDM